MGNHLFIRACWSCWMRWPTRQTRRNGQPPATVDRDFGRGRTRAVYDDRGELASSTNCCCPTTRMLAAERNAS